MEQSNIPNYRGFFVKICLLFILFPPKVFAAAYISISNTDMNMSFNSINILSEKEQTLLKGTGVGLQFGYFLSNAISFELGHYSIKFQRYTGETSNPNVSEYEMSPQYESLNYGIRWFVWEGLNFRIGGSKFEYDPKLESEEAYSELPGKKESQTSSYYGVGVGLTFKKMQLFFDLTVFPSAETENSNLSEMGIRVFF